VTRRERERFEVEAIKVAWQRLWPQTPWLRDAIDMFTAWTSPLFGLDDDWDSGPSSTWHVVEGFDMRLDTARLSDEEYVKMVNWGTAIGFPMFAPLLMQDWRSGPSFSSSWALTPVGDARRAYLWEHKRAMECPPVLTKLIKGEAATLMVEALTAQAKMGLAAMGVTDL